MFNFLKNYSKNEEKFIIALKGNNNNAAAVCTSYINNLFDKFKATRTSTDERAVIKEFIIRFYRLPKPNETWQEIETDKYDIEVSNWGRTRFLKPWGVYKVGDIYRPSINTEGYVNGFGGGIHCLVAKAFVGERPDGYVVDHINGCNCDNRAENLQYLTRGDNIKKGWEARKKTKKKQQKKRQTTEVEQYDKDGKLIAVYPSAVYAAKVNGWKRTINGSISKSCIFGHPTKGFYWKRRENND